MNSCAGHFRCESKVNHTINQRLETKQSASLMKEGQQKRTRSLKLVEKVGKMTCRIFGLFAKAQCESKPTESNQTYITMQLLCSSTPAGLSSKQPNVMAGENKVLWTRVFTISRVSLPFCQEVLLVHTAGGTLLQLQYRAKMRSHSSKIDWLNYRKRDVCVYITQYWSHLHFLSASLSSGAGQLTSGEPEKALTLSLLRTHT